MTPNELPEPNVDAEWRERFKILQNVPVPELRRGRVRLLAEAQKRAIVPSMPRRLTYALALGVGLAVILLIVVMGSAMGALHLTEVALTRTDTAQTLAPAVVPANAITPAPDDRITLIAPRTPLPNIVPEPPRSPALVSTQTLAP